MSRTRLLLPLILVLSLGAGAKDKKKVTLPADILRAETVLVVIRPDAGEPVNDPTANRRALDDVEKALMKWHRFDLAMDASTADLVIAVRKGTGQTARPTIQNSPIDNRPVIFEPSDGSVRVGGQQGHPPDMTRPTGGPSDPSPRIGSEIGPSEDSFEVYRGKVEYPLDAPPVWRYIGHDGLRSPAVPAVEEFRKALDEAEKAVAPKSQP
jgi:hypothetical protein